MINLFRVNLKFLRVLSCECKYITEMIEFFQTVCYN